MKTVLCLFGGRSTEYEVSLRSVCTVLSGIDRAKYNVLTLGITREGSWLLYEGETEAIRNDTWHTLPGATRPAFLSPDFGEGCLYAMEAGGNENAGATAFSKIPVHVILPVLHGAYAEDGTLQGLLAMTGIPFVGPGCAASAIAMDKAYTKLILNNYDIPQALCRVFTRGEIEGDINAVCAQAEALSHYPLFVKPANAGSSVGVSKAKDRDSLVSALRLAASFDTKVLVEECIVGREIECAVLGNEDPLTTVPGEINPGSDFYDYETKYVTDVSADYIPARIPEDVQDTVRAYAKKIYTVLGCKGLSRVDFFVKEDGGVIFNEINTLPGFTSISMYPKLWAHMGLDLPTLTEALIDTARGGNR